MSGTLLAILASDNAPLTISLSPTSIYTLGPGGGVIVSDPVTATAEGGALGYSYAWTYISGDSYTITSPAAATTTFSAFVAFGLDKLGTYRCTVTDAVGRTAHEDIVVELSGV